MGLVSCGGKQQPRGINKQGNTLMRTPAGRERTERSLLDADLVRQYSHRCHRIAKGGPQWLLRVGRFFDPSGCCAPTPGIWRSLVSRAARLRPWSVKARLVKLNGLFPSRPTRTADGAHAFWKMRKGVSTSTPIRRLDVCMEGPLLQSRPYQ